MTDKEDRNRRARGMGGNITSGAEENLLGHPGTRYYGEHITVHEFSHNVMSAMRDSGSRSRSRRSRNCVRCGEGRRASTKTSDAENTAAEYFAEGTQWWFWSNYEWFDGQTRLQTPDDLKAYDPRLYAILDKVYLGHHIPADIYYSRNIPPARRQ